MRHISWNKDDNKTLCGILHLLSTDITFSDLTPDQKDTLESRKNICAACQMELIGARYYPDDPDTQYDNDPNPYEGTYSEE